MRPQSQGASVRLTNEEERKGVNRIVKLLLCKDEYKCAVSRKDLSDALKGEGVPGGQANVNALVEGAKKKIKHVFGFEVVEGAKSELYAGESFTQNTQAKQANQKLYMLRNCLATPPADQDPDAPPLDVEDAAVKTRVQLIELLATPQPTDFSLVLNVLALIALSGFKMKREDLLEALRSLDPPLRRGETLEDLLTKLQTQMYIDDKQEKDEEDQKQTFYLPGLRAEKEVTRRRIVDYAEFVFGERMSAKERSRLLPDEEQDADDDEMQA